MDSADTTEPTDSNFNSGGEYDYALLEAGLNEEKGSIGGFSLIRRLGIGGMGVVYKVEDCVSRCVALKCMKEPALATPADERRFLFGAESQATLRHPHVVPVYHVDTCHGRPFFTMELLEGHLGELLQQRRKQAGRPWGDRYFEDDLKLMVKVADAVHFAHTHGLLHRDLKPANILLDDCGEPKIADFGLAKRLDGVSSWTEPGTVAGTVAYMAPEQARGLVLDQRADIYALGAILYELLTGFRPFDGTPDCELLFRVSSSDPVPSPRKLNPAVSREFEDVCLKCLEKDPEQRYSNALALCDDLRSLLEVRPTSIAPRSRIAGCLYWFRRNSDLAWRIASIVGVAVLACSLVGYVWLGSKWKERDALETNAFIANAQSGAALFQFREYADRLELAARDPDVVRQAEVEEWAVDPPAGLKNLAHGLDSAFVIAQSGRRRTGTRLVAQWPTPPLDTWGKNYEFRDYFWGAAELARRRARAVYFARAFRSERDKQIKFALSTPLYRDGVWVGVLAVLIAADSAFGRLSLKEGREGRHLTALIGPRDVDRGQPLEPGDPKHFVFLIHDQLQRGNEIRVPETPALRAAYPKGVEPGRQLTLPATAPLMDSSYRDPVPGHEGEWYAAFAPIGATGYVLSVQSRKDAGFSIPVATRAAWLWLALVLVLPAGLLFARQRRRT